MSIVKLLPLGRTAEVERGSTLDSVLSAHGVEFPCGGAGICRGCRVRVLDGAIPISAEMQEAFTDAELAAGWRLACCEPGGRTADTRDRTMGDARIWATTRPWSTSRPRASASRSTSALPRWHCRPSTCGRRQIVAVETALNPQAAHGADLMSRIEFALRDRTTLTTCIRAGDSAL